MSEEKEQTITIDDTTHKLSDLSKEQMRLVNHVGDLDNKLLQIGFNMEQAQGGRNHFMSLLTASLETQVAPVEEAAAPE